jgi:CRISPR-associated exonuclease Cas4
VDEPMSDLIVLALALLALLIGLASAYLMRRGGLRGRIISSDSVVAQRARTLRSARYGVVGKPDYLLKERGAIVPVELKPTRESDTPWLRDVVQLAAYCLLLEEHEPRFGGYGYLRYASQTFRIDFTPRVKTELLRTLASMRTDLTSSTVSRSHRDARRCARCSFVRVCGESLTAP